MRKNFQKLYFSSFFENACMSNSCLFQSESNLVQLPKLLTNKTVHSIPQHIMMYQSEVPYCQLLGPVQILAEIQSKSIFQDKAKKRGERKSFVNFSQYPTSWAQNLFFNMLR